MAASKNLVEDSRDRIRGRDSLRELGGRLYRWCRAAASWAGVEVIRREALCAGIASIFAATVVIPGVLIFWDRSLPFEYVDTAMVEKVIAPGQNAHFRLLLRRMNKDCHGSVEKFFFDSTGRPFPLGTEPTIYNRLLERSASDEIKPIIKNVAIPADAADGEGTYVSFPEFWCNGLQWFVPIKAPTLRAKITVAAVRR